MVKRMMALTFSLSKRKYPVATFEFIE